VDPSQGTGIRELVVPMSLAAIAAGSDGLMIEIHNNPEHALSDGPQSLYPEDFAQMIPKLKKFAEAAGRTIGLQGKMNSETVKL
jgi:3-deoxy-7-phosphoheptulonate synthase